MKLSFIHSVMAVLAVFLIAGCNPGDSTGDDKSNSDTTSNTTDDTGETNEVTDAPVIGFTSVDFRSVPDDYYDNGVNLLIGVAAEITDVDGNDDIVFAGFVYDNEDGGKTRITLKDTRADTIEADQQNDFDESLELYYDTWYYYNSVGTTWNIQNLYFFAYDSDDNYVRKDYDVSQPNGDALNSETFVYSPVTYSGETTNGVKALSAPEITLLTWNSVDGQITLEFSGSDDRIRTTAVKFYYNDNNSVYTTTTLSLLNAVYDETTQTYSFPDGSIILDEGQTNADIQQARLLVTDDPDQELPAYSNWWHYQSWSSKVAVTDL